MNVPKKTLTKRDKEDMRKKEDEIQTEAVYKDFVASFDGQKSTTKTFVRGDVINPDAGSMFSNNIFDTNRYVNKFVLIFIFSCLS